MKAISAFTATQVKTLSKCKTYLYNAADEISVDGLNITESSTAIIYCLADNDSISAANITGSGILTIVGGTQTLKMLAESADIAKEVAATIEADNADTVTIQENGKAYIIYGDSTYFIDSSKGDITFKLGKAIIPDGLAGELSDGTFTFGGVGVVAGQPESITVDAEGRVIDATTVLFKYILTS